jgi:hypothetical protein
MAPVPVGRHGRRRHTLRQLCVPRVHAPPKAGPIMLPSAHLRCGVTAALRAGPVPPLTAGWLCPRTGLCLLPAGLERRKDTGRPHVVADDGRGGTSPRRRRTWYSGSLPSERVKVPDLGESSIDGKRP